MPKGGSASESTRPNVKLPAQKRVARMRKTYGGIFKYLVGPLLHGSQTKGSPRIDHLVLLKG
jgi:hypothetical protein